MAERTSQHEFHAHTARKLLHALAAVKAETLEVTAEQGRVPRAIGSGHDASHVTHAQLAGKRHAIEHHADALLDLGSFLGGSARTAVLPHGAAEQLRLTPIGAHQAQQRLDERRLAGAVGAHKAHDAAGLNRKAHPVELELSVRFS